MPLAERRPLRPAPALSPMRGEQHKSQRVVLLIGHWFSCACEGRGLPVLRLAPVPVPVPPRTTRPAGPGRRLQLTPGAFDCGCAGDTRNDSRILEGGVFFAKKSS
jgi:hypothetical protein